MDTFAILLRGINVGGRRPIAMLALRETFADMGFDDPVTYIQSGNIVVGSRRPKSSRTVSTMERRLSDAFDYDARVVVRTTAEMAEIVRKIPKDWDAADRTMRHNVIFLTDHVNPRDIVGSVSPKPEIESLRAGEHVLYWAAPLRTLTKTAMIKLSSHPSYPEMTARNLRTTLKLYELMQRRTSTDRRRPR